jgi:hypothetical protein
MFSQGVKYGMSRITAISIDLQVILDGEEGFGFQWYSSKSLSLSDDINDWLVSIGLEIPNLQVAYFSFS